jgi:hypothetical protein
MRPVPETNTEGNLEASHVGPSGGDKTSEITLTGSNLAPHLRSTQPLESSASFEQPYTINRSTSLDMSLHPQDWQMAGTVSSTGGYQQTSVRETTTYANSLNLSLDEADLHPSPTTGWSVGNTSLTANVPQNEAM